MYISIVYCIDVIAADLSLVNGNRIDGPWTSQGWTWRGRADRLESRSPQDLLLREFESIRKFLGPSISHRETATTHTTREISVFIAPSLCLR